MVETRNNKMLAVTTRLAGELATKVVVAIVAGFLTNDNEQTASCKSEMKIRAIAIIPSVIVRHPARSICQKSIDDREDMNNSHNGIIHHYATPDRDETKQGHEKPEERILRAQKDFVLGKVNDRFCRVSSPMKPAVGR